MAYIKFLWNFMFIGLVAAQDNIPITMVTFQPFNAELRDPYPEYYCYLNSPDADAGVTAGRVWETRRSRTDTNNNPAPPSPQLVSDSSYPAGSAVYRVSLSFSHNTQSFAFGTFSCEASKEGRKDTRVSNIVMNSNVLSSPADGLVTQTVNEGDTGVEIRMDVLGGHSVQAWYRNEQVVSSSRFTASGGTLSIINTVQKNLHEGVYEAVTDFMRMPRMQPRHGLKRLIVRSCTANHWGPPDCAGICDNCYNGGICDDETGRCICPPGFMGTNCLTACGGNRFGYSCEFQCSYDEDDDEDSCSGLQFCLLDPFGCRCNTGWKDLRCNTVCSEGTFGASCLQDCHCEGFCDRFTGVCNGTCETGWSGDNCQIPDICPPGFFGRDCTDNCYCKNNTSCNKTTGECQNRECIPGFRVYPGSLNCQECQGDSFGASCLQVCRCAADACNKVTGDCSGQCKPQWVDSYQCLAGLEYVSSSKINPNTTSDVSCVTQISSNSANMLTVNVSREPDQVETRGIEFLNRTRMGNTEVWRFTADVTEEEELFCLVLDQRGIIVARLSTTIMEYDLPVLSSSPTPVTRTTTSIIIMWREWDPNKDDGDPPVVAYIPYYREAASEVWINGSVLLPGENLEFEADDLETDTEYSFSIAVVREGVNGEGPRGPSVNLRTNCDDITPQNVKAYLNETTKQVNVSWQIPDNFTCSSGISSFFIYYKIEGGNQEPRFLAKAKGDARWSTVNAQVLGEGEFSIFVTLTIDEESALSQESEEFVITPQDIDGPVSSDNPIAIIIILVIAVVVLTIVVLMFVLLKVRKKKDNIENGTSYTQYNGGYETDAVTLGTDGSEYHSPQNDSGKGKTSDEPPPVMNLCDETESEDEIKEDEDEKSASEDSDILYGNLQKPQKVKVADLREYINNNLQEGRLEQEFSLLKPGKQYPWTVAEKKENKKKNRFRNLFTYDHSRVVLEALLNNEHSDYYNASYIMNQKGKKAFIAAQGPNTASLNDFWRMVWSENVSTIVMVTNVIEKGKDRCLQYWPNEVGTMKEFGDIKVVLEQCTGFADYVIRKFNVIQLNDARVIYQLHYVSWPDMGTPKQPTPLIAFVKQAKLMHKDKKTPMVVHCSAGIGRTGTYIALYSLLDNVMNDEYVNVFDFVKKMRQNRVNMVQTGKQYVFLYKCLMEASLTNDTEMTRDELSDVAVDQDQRRPKKEFQLLQQFEEDDKAFHNYLKEAGCKRPFSMSEKSYNLSIYIVANLLKSFKKEDGYITCAYPKPDTIDQFWRLVYSWKCSLIVMLDQLDADKVPYWPESDSSKHGKYSVFYKGTEAEPAFVLRQFDVSQDEAEDVVSVYHLQLTSWPARDNLNGLDSIIRKVSSLQTSQMLNGPVIVHCVDGEGLSGIFVAVSSEIERLQITGKVDMFKTVRQLKETNTDILASEEDYLLCYKLLLQYLQEPHTYQNM